MGIQSREKYIWQQGVTGTVNIDMTPEFAAKLSAAFTATLKSRGPLGSAVTVPGLHR